MKTHMIINPSSAGGKTAARIPGLLEFVRRRCGDGCSVFVTDSPFSATRSAREAIERGSELLIAVGGDGTVQETVNGFFSNGSLTNPDCELGILSSGTGNGFAQSLGLGDSFEEQIEQLFDGVVRRLDIGVARFRNGTDEAQRRYFVNECQLGIGGEVVRRVRKSLKRFGGRAAFALGTLPAVFTYKNQMVTLTVDAQPASTIPVTGIVVANGAFTGGGMNLTPGATMGDGFLDVLLMLDMSVAQRLLSFPKIYSGGHAGMRCFRLFRAKTITIDSDGIVPVEADGELLGATPCTVEIMPSILPVRCRPEHQEVEHATNF